jgi:hypothetical protein
VLPETRHYIPSITSVVAAVRAEKHIDVVRHPQSASYPVYASKC